MQDARLKTIGELIKEEMQERGIKATTIAKKMNVSRQSINQIDRRKKFDIDFLKRLKDASGIDFTRYAYESVINVFKEPEVIYEKSSNTIELNLQLKISADQNTFIRLGELIKSLKVESKKFGFTLK